MVVWLKVSEDGFTTTYGNDSVENLFRLTKKYFVHKTSNDLKKTVTFIAGMLVYESLDWKKYTCSMLAWLSPLLH